MKIKTLYIALFLMSTFCFSQQKEDKIFNDYSSQLSLSANQEIKFKEALKVYNKILYSENISAYEFNKTKKLRRAEFFKILNDKQFILFKEIQSKVEPELKYRLK